MNLTIRIAGTVYEEALADLQRPHPFAYERIGFFSAATALAGAAETIVLLARYHVIPDGHYLRDSTCGARIGTEAIRVARQRILDEDLGGFHVHLHSHSGVPGPSVTDLRETPRLIHSFASVGPKLVHGAIILTDDRAWSSVLLPGAADFVLPSKITTAGFPLRLLS